MKTFTCNKFSKVTTYISIRSNSSLINFLSFCLEFCFERNKELIKLGLKLADRDDIGLKEWIPSTLINFNDASSIPLSADFKHVQLCVNPISFLAHIPFLGNNKKINELQLKLIDEFKFAI